MLHDFGAFAQQLLLLLQLLLMADVSVHCAIMFVDEFDTEGLAGRVQRKSTKNYYSIIEQEGDSTPFDSSKSTIEWDSLDPRKQTVGSSYSVIETSGTSTGPRHFAYSRREYDPATENWSDEEQPLTRGAGHKKGRVNWSDEEQPLSRGAGHKKGRVNWSAEKQPLGRVAGRKPSRINWSEEEQPPRGTAGHNAQFKFPQDRERPFGHSDRSFGHSDRPFGHSDRPFDHSEDDFNVPKQDVELIKKRPKRPKLSAADTDSGPARKQKKPKPKKHNFEKPSAALSQASVEEDHEEPAAPLLGASSGSLVSKKSKGDSKKSGSYLSGDDGDSYEEGYDAEKHYDKEGGKKYVEAHKSEAGDEGHKGYKKQEAFDAAEDEKHDKEEKKAEVAEKHGVKKGHLEQEKQYGEGFEGNAGEKGISVTKKGGHKKGHKKSGFHKVHHKDEYKKDEVFYDEDHDLDEHEEHAHEQEKHAKEKGGEAKKAVIDSKYHEGHGEKKGLVDKGHNFEEATGHKKELSEEAHHDSHSEFDKKGGLKEGEKHGHVEGGGKKKGYSGHDYF